MWVRSRAWMPCIDVDVGRNPNTSLTFCIAVAVIVARLVSIRRHTLYYHDSHAVRI